MKISGFIRLRAAAHLPPLAAVHDRLVHALDCQTLDAFAVAIDNAALDRRLRRKFDRHERSVGADPDGRTLAARVEKAGLLREKERCPLRNAFQLKTAILTG